MNIVKLTCFIEPRQVFQSNVTSTCKGKLSLLLSGNLINSFSHFLKETMDSVYSYGQYSTTDIKKVGF